MLFYFISIQTSLKYFFFFRSLLSEAKVH